MSRHDDTPDSPPADRPTDAPETSPRPQPAPAQPPPSALAEAAWQLEPVWPHERKGVLRNEAGLLLDDLLTRVARGRGALDVALSEGLAALAEGDRLLRLGWSGAGDYARERLGVSERTTQAMVRLGRELRRRPLLRQAVWSGEVSVRKAQSILAVAQGDAEAAWVERARRDTVRALEVAVRAEGGGSEEEEAWMRVGFHLPEEIRLKVDRALDLAGRLLGPAAPQWQRFEAMAQEYLGSLPVGSAGSGGPGGEPGLDHGAAAEAAVGRLAPWDRDPWNDPTITLLSIGQPVATWRAAVEEALEQESGRWSFLSTAEPVPAPSVEAAEGDIVPRALDAELTRLAALRDEWDELVGHLAMLVRSLGLWRDMCFVSFSHYCSERLGLALRSVEQRIWLTRKLHELPQLRAAMRARRVSYEQARIVAGVATEATLPRWLERAGQLTCLDLRREVQAAETAQRCARQELDIRLPRAVAVLLAAALEAARRASETWLTPAACLERVADHFISTYEGLPSPRRTPNRRVLERDGGFCQVPGCSRAAAHAHHLVYRSRGGGDEASNKVSTCAPHHLHGVHRGWVRVSGVAPHGLRWELGEK